MKLDNSHLKFVLILAVFIIVVYLLANTLKCKEGFVIKNDLMNVKNINSPLSNLFDINRMCKDNNKKNLGWKCYWRNNHSHSSVENDTSFKGTAFETYLDKTPLLYDGIKPI